MQSYSTARILGLAGAEICVTGCGCANANPAALAAGHRLYAEMSGHSPFGIKELSICRLELGRAGPRQGAAADISYMGFDQYQEGSASCRAARLLWGRMALGAAWRYTWWHIVRYGQRGGHSLELGLLHQCAPSFSWGAVIKELALGKNLQTPPDEFYSWQIGCRWSAGLPADCYLEYHRQSPWPARIRMAMEIKWKQILRLRWGWALEPSIFSFGFGIVQKKLRMDYAVSEHPDLGLTYGMTLCFCQETP
ncbi:hypothetical protein GX408_07755 [bacterium]|nr:hypothetical protein [bacterium]